MIMNKANNTRKGIDVVQRNNSGYYPAIGMLAIALLFVCMSSDAIAADNIKTIDGLTTSLNTWLGGPLKKTAMYILGIGVTVVGILKNSWGVCVVGVVIIIFNIVLQSYINGLS